MSWTLPSVFISPAGGQPTVSVTACAAPSISVGPSGASKTVGESVTFSTVAAGTATLNYQWRKNTADIPGANSSSYNIPSVVTGDAGNYDVVVSNGCGSATSTAAALAVNKATPTITWNNPADITYGAALGATQLNATAPVAGSFNYTPASGTTLGAGNGQTLSVAFTPTDTANYNTANKNVSINVLKAGQTISFGALAAKTFGDPDFNVSATATSGLAVSFAASGDCTVAGDSVHITGAGSCTITASQAGDSNYNAATNVPRAFTINKAGSTTTVTVGNATYDTNPHGGSAGVTGAGGLNQSLTVSYAGRNGTLYPSSTTAPTDAGDYTASANFAGDDDHTGSSDSEDFTIAKADAIINVSGYTGTYDGSAHGATGTATGAGDIDLSSLLNLGASFTDAPGGTANWSFAGNNNYNSDSGAASIVINKAASTTAVSFEAGPYTYRASAFTATAGATGAGGLSTPVSVSYSGDCVNVTATDGCTATANYAGDTNHDPSADSESITITKANASITVNGYTGTYDGAAHGATGTATGVGGADLGAGLNLGATYTDAPGGTAHWTFSGGTNYGDQSGDVEISIGKADAAIVITPYDVIYDGAAHTATGTATGVGGTDLSSALTLTGTTHTAAGTYSTDSWSFAGGTNYNDDGGTVTDKIGKAPSLTTVTCAGTPAYTGSAIEPCSVTVTGAGGLSLNPAPVYANNVDAGTDTASASYTFAGDDNHETSSDTQSFSIGKATSTVTVTCPAASQTYTGSPIEPCSAVATGAGLGAGVPVTPVSYTGNVNVGTAGASATWGGDANHDGNTGNASFGIGKAASAVTVDCAAGAPYVYTGVAQTPCTATATGAGMSPVNVSASLVYSNNTGAGSATADASWPGDDNHTGSNGSGGFSIGKADATINVTGYTGTYDGSAHGASGTATGVLGEDLNGLLDLGASFTDFPGGTAHWTFNAGGSNANYNTAGDDAPVTINKRAVTVTPDSGQSKVYGATDPALTYQVTNGSLVSGEGFGGELSRAPGAGVGLYAIEQGTLALSANYTLNFASGVNFEITKKGLTITASSPSDFAYGGAVPAVTPVYDGFIPGDNAGNSLSPQPACVTSYALGSGVGPYTTSCSGASSSNYGLSYVGGGFNVTKASLVVTPADKTKTHGYTFTAFTGALNSVQNGDNITPNYSSAGAPTAAAVNTYPITVTLNDPGSKLGNYNVTLNQGTLTVTKRKSRVTVLAPPTPGSGYYGACVTVSVKVEDIGDGSAAGIAAASAMSSAPVTLNIGASAKGASTNGGGVAAAAVPVTDNASPPSYQAGGSFAGDATHDGSSASQPFTVLASQILPVAGGYSGIYTGENVFWTTSPSSSTATLTLSTTVMDATGTCAGDIRTARVTFATRNGDGSFSPINGATNLPVGLADPNNKQVGTASATVQFNIGNADATTLNIAVIVNGNYYLNTPLYDEVVTVAKALPGQIIGAGSIDNNNSSGYLKGAAGETTGFGFNVKYNKSLTNPQGQASFIVRSMNKPDGTQDGKVHTYMIKSNAISTLVVKGKTSNFSSKASIVELLLDGGGQVTGTVSVDGGAILQLAMTDNAAPSLDTLAITVQRKDGGLWFSSNWMGLPPKTTEKGIQSGGAVSVQ